LVRFSLGNLTQIGIQWDTLSIVFGNNLLFLVLHIKPVAMILIVDDIQENIFSLKRLLESKGYQTDSAPSGEEALKLAIRNNYVLIIMDVQMPDMDGFEVAETLKGLNRTKDIPIIFLTAVNRDKSFIAKGYQSGGIDYVTKPIDPEILLLKVGTFYRLYEQNQMLINTKEALRHEVEVRKRAEQNLLNRSEYLQGILESIPQIAFTTDRSGTIEFTNQKWYDYSTSQTEFPQGWPGESCYLAEWLGRTYVGETYQREVRIKNLISDEFRYHLLRITPVNLPGGEFNWVGTFTDIEDHKRIEKKKDAFISIASHELKTPLTGIRAYAQLAERSLKDSQDTKAYGFVKKTLEQSERLNALVTDLLDVANIEEGRIKLRKKIFDLEKVIENVCMGVVQSYPQRSVEITRHGEPLKEKILGDQIRIEQVLNNFLGNAVKYAPNHDRVELSTEISDGELKISVTDRGIGIPPEKLPYVFNKFYRVEESSVKFQGLGLGLFICQEIIQGHGGICGVESTPGLGSTFYFKIPLIYDNEQ